MEEATAEVEVEGWVEGATAEVEAEGWAEGTTAEVEAESWAEEATVEVEMVMEDSAAEGRVKQSVYKFHQHMEEEVWEVERAMAVEEMGVGLVPVREEA